MKLLNHIKAIALITLGLLLLSVCVVESHAAHASAHRVTPANNQHSA